jgi:pimeloyl-ACP methyl ester carboxylesterase
MSSPAQLVRFAEVHGRRVAWGAVGEGPPIVMAGWWMSHLELDWKSKRFRDFVSALARYRTVVRYDRPGTGLSDRDGSPGRSPPSTRPSTRAGSNASFSTARTSAAPRSRTPPHASS